MFQKIRYRLLMSNLLVFSLVLAGFASVVRIVFVRNLKQQLTTELIVLGKAAVGNAEMEDGVLEVEEEFLAQPLVTPSQAIEWYDLQGKLFEKRGTFLPQVPFHPRLLNTETIIDTQGQEPPIHFVIMPLFDRSSGHLMGYVRASQLLDELDTTILLVDIGLGVGVGVAMLLSGGGILWLNKQAMQPIEESFQRLKQFTADASHELRNPLMAISSNMEVALKYPEGMREEDRSVMHAVVSATDQMTQLTEDLLLLARTDKVSTMTLAPVSLSKLLKDVVQLYRPQADINQISLTAAIEADLWLRGAPINLARSFANLLQNAIRYTPKGGKVVIKARCLGNQLQIIVKDTGIGIASENLEKIFERFWQVDQARTHDVGGSGLGLSITQAIIQSHGGTIEVTSQLGIGSCFTIQLPGSGAAGGYT